MNRMLTLAVKFETLRLYGAVAEIPKYTASSTANLQIRDRQYAIPPETIIWCNSATVHSQPRYWGPDSLVWRPTRWLAPETPRPSTAIEARLGAETIREPNQGRVCPVVWRRAGLPGSQVRAGGVRGRRCGGVSEGYG